jgi:hypothetical protein
MEVFMFRKAIVVAGATALVLASITAVPASAATKVSNGVACKKAGQTTKVSGSSYRCAKNPLVKNSKLTWLSLDCLNTANTYNKAVANLPKIKAASDETVAEIEANIQKIKLEVDKATKLIPEYQAKLITYNATLNTLNADTANLVKNKKTIEAYVSAVKNLEIAISQRTKFINVGSVNDINRSLKQIEIGKSQYVNSKADVDTSRDMAKLICGKGF